MTFTPLQCAAALFDAAVTAAVTWQESPTVTLITSAGWTEIPGRSHGFTDDLVTWEVHADFDPAFIRAFLRRAAAELSKPFPRLVVRVSAPQDYGWDIEDAWLWRYDPATGTFPPVPRDAAAPYLNGDHSHVRRYPALVVGADLPGRSALADGVRALLAAETGAGEQTAK